MAYYWLPSRAVFIICVFLALLALLVRYAHVAVRGQHLHIRDAAGRLSATTCRQLVPWILETSGYRAFGGRPNTGCPGYDAEKPLSVLLTTVRVLLATPTPACPAPLTTPLPTVAVPLTAPLTGAVSASAGNVALESVIAHTRGRERRILSPPRLAHYR